MSARPSNGSTRALAASPAGWRAPGDRVDGEVATGEIGHHVGPELHAVRAPEVRVLVLGAERGHLEHVVAPADGHGPEPVLVDGAGEQLDELLGQGIGGQVPVRGLAAEQRVAERPANDVRRRVRRHGAVEELDHRPAGRIARETCLVSADGRRHAGSVPAEEEVVAPGLVAIVRRGTA